MLNQEQQENVKSLFLENKNIKEISNELGVNYSQIFTFIKAAKLDEYRIEKLKEQITELCKKKYTRQEISSKLNISINQMNFIIKKYSIKHDFRGVHQKRLEEKILEEYKKNKLPIKDMCIKFNVTDAKVRRIFNKYNLQKIRRNPKRKFLILTEEKYKELIHDLRTTDKSYAFLSQKYGISRQRIGQIKKKNEIIRIKDKV